jgi:Flp pilus assembly protein TadB
MNAEHEPSAEKKTLVDTLLAIDSRMPTSSAEGREVAQKVLRRDRRRVRILTWATSGFFLLTIIGICLSASWYYIRVVPHMDRFGRDINELGSQIHNLEPELSKRSPQTEIAVDTAGACYALYMVQLGSLWAIATLLAVMLAAAVCTVLLIMATRGATLRQIQASLLALSEQFDALQQSLQAGHSSGGGQATQERSG